MTSARSPDIGPLRQLTCYLTANALLAVTAIVGGLVILALTAASAGIYDAVAEEDGVSSLDQPTLDHVIAMRTPLANQVLTVFTHLGGLLGMTLIASTVTLLLVWRLRSLTPLILMTIAVAGSLTFTTVGKAIVGRARPPLSDAVPPYEHAFSFPSGHTLNSTVIAGMVAYLVARRLTSRIGIALCVVLAVAWAGAMGFSRIFLGHHWLTDVIFAWLLGMAWLAVLITAHAWSLLYAGPTAHASRPQPRVGQLRGSTLRPSHGEPLRSRRCDLLDCPAMKAELWSRPSASNFCFASVLISRPHTALAAIDGRTLPLPRFVQQSAPRSGSLCSSNCRQPRICARDLMAFCSIKDKLSESVEN